MLQGDIVLHKTVKRSTLLQEENTNLNFYHFEHRENLWEQSDNRSKIGQYDAQKYYIKQTAIAHTELNWLDWRCLGSNPGWL